MQAPGTALRMDVAASLEELDRPPALLSLVRMVLYYHLISRSDLTATSELLDPNDFGHVLLGPVSPEQLSEAVLPASSKKSPIDLGWQLLSALPGSART